LSVLDDRVVMDPVAKGVGRAAHRSAPAPATGPREAAVGTDDVTIGRGAMTRTGPPGPVSGAGADSMTEPIEGAKADAIDDRMTKTIDVAADRTTTGSGARATVIRDVAPGDSGLTATNGGASVGKDAGAVGTIGETTAAGGGTSVTGRIGQIASTVMIRVLLCLIPLCQTGWSST